MSLVHDLRQSIRALAKSPGFTAVAIATLGLGIGGSTAVFTVVDSVLLRPLNFAEPEQLTQIVVRPSIRPEARGRVSPEYLYEWRLESRAFHDMAGWYDEPVNLTGEGAPLEVLADHVTPNFFGVVGTPTHLGRTFTVGSDLSGVEPEVVLSHGFWHRRYGGDPDVIGQPITLDGESFTIIGVMPAGFVVHTEALAESRAEIWLPFALDPEPRTGHMGGFLVNVARLAPDVSLEEARSELSLISQRVAEEYSNGTRSRRWEPAVVPLHEAMVRDVRLALIVLFGAVGILLLIACANVANLVLSRVTTRQTELAIRVSLGATVGRLVRLVLSESLVLAAVGGALGVALAVAGTGFLVSILPAGVELPRTLEIGVDLRVLAFALLATLSTAIIFGLVPSLSSVRSVLHLSPRQTSDGSLAKRIGNRLRSFLIVWEVALALILLVGAGLLGRSVWELGRVDPGFHADRVVTLRTKLPETRYPSDDRIRAFGNELVARLGGLPGVRAVGSVNELPMTSSGLGTSFEIEGRPPTPPEDRPGTWIATVGGGYFDAMGIPLLRGRLFGDGDTETTSPVYVIDESLARRHWPDEDPIGAHLALRWRRGAEPRRGEIIGVVGSVRYGLARDPNPILYSWFPQDPNPRITIVARTTGDPFALAGPFAAEVAEIDPDQPIAEIRLMEDLVSAHVSQPRATLVVLGSFAAAALLLSSIGLYGVLAFGVAQRTKEIGIRVAVGADRGDVLRMIMRSGLRLTGAGLAIGIVASLALGRVVAGLLYGVAPTDTATLMAGAFFLFAVAVLASYLPARHASRLDPIDALKHD